jgi:hypothetical protein
MVLGFFDLGSQADRRAKSLQRTECYYYSRHAAQTLTTVGSSMTHQYSPVLPRTGDRRSGAGSPVAGLANYRKRVCC